MKKYSDVDDKALDQEIYECFQALFAPFNNTTQNLELDFSDIQMSSWEEIEKLALELEAQNTQSK